MAISISSALQPKAGQKYYLLEDVYVKGGFQVVDDVATRDAILASNRKVGMLVSCIDTGLIYKLESDLTTWTEFKSGGGGGGFVIVTNEEARDAIPEASRQVGMLVSCSENGKLYKLIGDLITWEAVGSDLNTRSRQVAYITNDIEAGGFVEFSFELGACALILGLEVSAPVLVEAFGDPDRTESNPYAFLATEDHLQDDGSMKFADGTILRTRRYSVFSNLETPPKNFIYFRLTNMADVARSVELAVTYLVLERNQTITTEV